ncbi:acyltransferase [Skermanella mucosa]|nr:acyltransferase [Skermanella mucosa]UEM21501.1 acyltransferase [Skermanella mucosa]
MDTLRGMAIVLVIFDHALYHAMLNSDSVPQWIATLSLIFNPLRMPLMVFLSGMLLSPSLRKGAPEYLAGKTRNILYPYVLWSTVYVSLWVVAAPFSGTPHSWSELLMIPYAPQGHMWFLHNLFLFYMIMLALQRVSRLVVAAVALAASGLVDFWYLDRFLFLLGFFALGDYAVQREDLISRLLANRTIVAVMAVLTIGMPATVLLLETDLRYRIPSIPLAVGGIGIMILLAGRIGDKPFSALFRHIGRNSLPAYILHWIILAVAVVVLKRIIPPDQGMLLFTVLGTIGFIGTLVAIEVINRLGLHWLFSWPKRARKKPRDVGRSDGSAHLMRGVHLRNAK